MKGVGMHVVEGEAVVGDGDEAADAVGEAERVLQVLRMTKARRYQGRGKRLIKGRVRIITGRRSEGRRWRGLAFRHSRMREYDGFSIQDCL
jgi:hypothetical protein